jgi:hypothetical protein
MGKKPVLVLAPQYHLDPQREGPNTLELHALQIPTSTIAIFLESSFNELVTYKDIQTQDSIWQIELEDLFMYLKMSCLECTW